MRVASPNPGHIVQGVGRRARCEVVSLATAAGVSSRFGDDRDCAFHALRRHGQLRALAGWWVSRKPPRLLVAEASEVALAGEDERGPDNLVERTPGSLEDSLHLPRALARLVLDRLARDLSIGAPERAVGAVRHCLTVLVIVHQDQVVWIPRDLGKGAQLLSNNAVGPHAG